MWARINVANPSTREALPRCAGAGRRIRSDVLIKALVELGVPERTQTFTSDALKKGGESVQDNSLLHHAPLTKSRIPDRHYTSFFVSLFEAHVTFTHSRLNTVHKAQK